MMDHFEAVDTAEAMQFLARLLWADIATSTETLDVCLRLSLDAT